MILPVVLNRRRILPRSAVVRCLVLVALLAENLPAEQAMKIQVENALLKSIEATKLSAEVAGQLALLEVVEGELVKRGQELGKVQDATVQLQHERAKLATVVARLKLKSRVDLQLAEKRAAVARNELERAELANQRVPETYPIKEIDRLRLVHESAILEIERVREDRELNALQVTLAENEERLTEELISRHRIVAPVDGMVVSLSRRVGEWVEPGTEILQLVKLDRLRIEGFIGTGEAVEVMVNRRAEVALRSGDRELVVAGRVAFVSPEINPVSNQTRVFLEIENLDGKLRPGMRVRAAILPVEP